MGCFAVNGTSEIRWHNDERKLSRDTEAKP